MTERSFADASQAAGAVAASGRRERNKQRRREAIKAAARQAFFGKGFAATTTREIAREAGVAEGTVFLHWKDKGDLLLAIINDDLDSVATDAFAEAPSGGPLLETLCRIFVPRYAYWSRHPQLFSASAYATMLARTMGRRTAETMRHERRQKDLQQGLARLIRTRQAEGRIDPGPAPEAIARMLYAIYLSEFRLWIAETPGELGPGIDHLRQSLRLALSGLETETLETETLKTETRAEAEPRSRQKACADPAS